MAETNKPIIVIQNVDYHFETVISIYQSLTNMGLSPYVYRCTEDKFGQEKFMLDHNINVATDEITKEACCGFLTSTYPNPKVVGCDAIPNFDNKIFDVIKNKIIYICHRFKKENDYLDNIFGVNKDNSLCLSPLAQNIGLDYFHPLEMPIEPFAATVDGYLKLTVQAHFQLNNRDYPTILNLLESIKNKKNIRLQFLGTNLDKLKTAAKKTPSKAVLFYDNLKENYFYRILNNYTNFIICCINDKMKEETYSKERYSSNFNHALALEKPIFCHEYFQEIYRLPGIYYNENNLQNKIDEMINIKEKEYVKLVENYKNLKQEYRNHNYNVITKKINYVCNF